MAEIATAVATLATVGIKLVQVVTQLGNFDDIKEDVERLSKDLPYLQSCLKDAENNPGRNSYVFQTWLADARQLVTRCENIADDIDLFTQKEPKRHTGCLSLRAMSSCCITYKTNIRLKYELSGQLKKLKSDIDDFLNRRIRYDHLNANSGTTSGTKNVDENLMQQRRSAPYAENEYMVGLDKTIKFLTTKLTDGDSDSFVISILGMGGLGKTTLARKLYNTVSQQYFTSRGWVYVSQECNTEGILKSLINSMIKPSNQECEFLIDIPSMEACLREYLSGRRFLMVVDDVWERTAWESLERAFPNCNNGSKVIITTRNEQVAALNNAYVHRLRYLDEKESWELFCRKALPRDTECPLNLIQIGKEMTTKCRGLPLAIVVLGGILLKKKRRISEWKIVSDNLLKELRNDSDHINAILTLSFNDLPAHLKQCFLYVAMFPEDFAIPLSELMRLWEIEDFITSDEEGCAEDASKSYFDELVGRSLLTMIYLHTFDHSTFRVHDLLRDLALRKARDIGFSLYYDGRKSFDVSKATPHSRLAIYHSHGGIPVGYTNDTLRVLLVGRMPEADGPCPSSDTPYHEWFSTVHQKFRNLRVLVTRIPIKSVPNCIGMMPHLKYLHISLDTHLDDVTEVPDTLGNLKALQTLFIGNGRVALPKSVLKMTKLKHLIGDFIFKSDEIGSLVCLETLDRITVEQWCRLDTTKLVNLRSLRLNDFTTIGEAELERFYNDLKNLVKLQTLYLWNADDSEVVSLPKIFERCPSIARLTIEQINLHSLLGLDKFAMNLQVLDIRSYNGCQNVDGVMSSIGKLPQLEALIIYLRCLRIQHVCWKEGFSQLRTLILRYVQWCSFTVEEGCMPLLEHLKLGEDIDFQGPDRLMRLIKPVW